jgi:hypothetical protein
MAIENRNGRQYYYRKRRVGRRVISEYQGGGEFGMFLAELDGLDREQIRAKRQAERLELAQWMACDQEVNQVLDLCTDLATAALLASGFHTHKGQWRRMR